MNTDKQGVAQWPAGRVGSEGRPSCHRNLECGDSSPLLRRRLVAVELPCASAPARVPALARAVNAPWFPHAPRHPTATSRLAKAVTSHRTPQPVQLDTASAGARRLRRRSVNEEGSVGFSGGSLVTRTSLRRERRAPGALRGCAPPNPAPLRSRAGHAAFPSVCIRVNPWFSNTAFGVRPRPAPSARSAATAIHPRFTSRHA